MNKGNKTKAFRSSSDVNNYNKLLTELDNNQTNRTNQTNLDNDTKEDDKINNYLKTLNKVYELYNSSPINQTTNKESNDPNAYMALETKENRHKLEFLYQRQRKLEYQQKLDEEKKKEELVEIERKNNRKKVNIQFEINNIGDLLKMIEQYPDDKDIEYNIDIHSLNKIKGPLEDLNSMIGMQNLKENIVDQILFYIQNLHKGQNNTNKKQVSNDFMHTVIYGPPGTGKTEIAKIIGSIFSNLGILTKGTFKKVTRSDLVAGFLGQTALKTKEVIKESLGGVLFIDEAYSLGNQEKRDSFSKECIDTLCEALSDHKDNLMVIIAGYETDLNECFFKYNQGLHSRFTWRFKIDEYSSTDLYNIFIKKINDNNWSIDKASMNVNVKWFEKNKGLFKYYGRDIETLFAKTKIAHSRRVFCLDENVKKKLTIADIDKGLEIYLKNGVKQKEEDEHIQKSLSYMYS
jgi:SpoVK/Ycf46/Vps4 family AAA+-type ATPase